MNLKYRTRLILFFVTAIAISTLAGVYSYMSTQALMKNSVKVFTESQGLTIVFKEIEEIHSNLEEYLSTSSSESLLSFYDHSNSITSNLSILEESADYTVRGVKIKNVIHMMEHYLSTLDQTVMAKRNRSMEAYTKGYQEAGKEYGYIGTYIKEIMSSDLSSSSDKFVQIQNRYDHVSRVNNILLVVVVAAVIATIIVFSIEITKPISQLAVCAKEVADGNFDVQLEPTKTSGEIKVLYQAFYVMIINIRKKVYELKEKQKLMNTLNEEKVNNLKMKGALREAELLALQSQVNPHFIYNTINIGAKIAMFQEDSVTCEYLENVADIFRYNLKGLDCDARLRDEIQNVVSYMYLLRTRFGDGVSFSMEQNCTDDILDIMVPRMTLQPLIENAYIHGIGEVEEGGTIGLDIHAGTDCVNVIVWDNGKGISEEKIAKLLYQTAGDNTGEKTREKEKGHTTGIGVDNVLKRLRLYFRKNDIMDIRCAEGKTMFILSLPILHK